MTGALVLADGAADFVTSPTLAIDEAVAAKRAAGEDIVHLGFGEASFPLHPSMRAALADAATRTAYGPVLGVPELREAIAAYLARERDFDARAARVVVGPGSKPLLFGLLRVLRGDVLLPAPSWVSYAPQARLSNKRVFVVPTDAEDCHTLSPDALETARREAIARGADPRILVVNTPSNPTGGVLAHDAVAALAAWCRGAGVTLVSDEIYAELVHGPRPHVSPASLYPEGTIVTGGLSKAFSAGGWRLGYALVPEGAAGAALVAALRALASEVWSSPSMPVQIASLAAFRADPDVARHVRRCARLHGHAAGRLHRGLVRLGARCPAPAGAFYLYPDFAPFASKLTARGVATSDDLAKHLLSAFSVATLPGTGFGDAPSALRLRLATSGLFGGAEPLDALLGRADDLPSADPASGTPIALPRLDRALDAFARFVASLDAAKAP